jgi:hypothetical protein
VYSSLFRPERERALQTKALLSGTAQKILWTAEVGLAKSLPADLVLLDDSKARRVAQDAGLSVVGCLGILEVGARRRLIPDLRQTYVDLLRHGIRFDLKLLQDSLARLGLPLDKIEDLLPASAAYRQAGRLLFPEPSRISGRPLISLKSGAVGLLAVGGGLDGVFGSGSDRHVSAWLLRKETDRFEETDGEGTVTIHERERFAHELSLVLVSGETAILK